jgi:hypothetical protein
MIRIVNHRYEFNTTRMLDVDHECRICTLDTVGDNFYYYHIDHVQGNIFTDSRMRDLTDLNSDYIKAEWANLNIPDKVIADVAAGKCKYIFNHSLEGFYWARLDVIEHMFGIDSSQYLWVSGCFRMKDDIPQVVYSNWWERNTAELIEREFNHVGKHHATRGQPAAKPIREVNDIQMNLIENRTARQYSNTVYNRRIRPHRIHLMMELWHHDLLDDMIWSWGGRVENRTPVNNPKIAQQYLKFFDGDREYLDALNEVLSWGNRQENKIKQENLHENMANWIAYEDIHATNYQLIVETWASNGSGRFLSEKSFKPFLLKQPFVLWGDPFSIDALKWHGYDTYDRWIDHSYDRETDPRRRLAMIIREVQRLNTLSKTEWADMLWDMRDTLNKNYENLKTAHTKWAAIKE